ncbi:hypothetical protein Tco_0740532 [Tanacetum coccineum]
MTRSFAESKTSLVIATNLSELELKKILIDKMESNKSIHRSDEQKNLYKALVNAYESDKLILDTYGDTVSFKRRRDDEDKDEEPFAGSNRGSKRRRAANLEEPAHQEFETGVTEDQPNEETPQLSDCSLAQKEDPRESFNELMDTPLDFLAFVMNRLKVDTLTPELLTGPTFELMKGSCKSLVELEYLLEEVYKATTEQLYWNNPEVTKTKAAYYGHIKWIDDLVPNIMWSQVPTTVRRDDDKLYKFKEGDFNRLRIQDIKDMLLLLIQGKLTNLTVEERLAFNFSLRMFHLAKQRQKEQTDAIDELYKFSDGTLNDVRTALKDHLKGIQMEYLP